MESIVVKQIKDNDTLRTSFIKLAIKTFDLSFKNWYKNGFWTDKYILYALVHHGRSLQMLLSASLILFGINSQNVTFKSEGHDGFGLS